MMAILAKLINPNSVSINLVTYLAMSTYHYLTSTQLHKQ